MYWPLKSILWAFTLVSLLIIVQSQHNNDDDIIQRNPLVTSSQVTLNGYSNQHSQPIYGHKEQATLNERPPVNPTNNDQINGRSKVDDETDSELKLKKSLETSRSKDKLLAWNSNRWSKLPIRPPKLRISDKPVQRKQQRISYGSAVRTRSANKTDSGPIPMEYTNSSKLANQDILELSSSEKRTSRLRLRGHRHSDDQSDQPIQEGSRRLIRFQSDRIITPGQEASSASSSLSSTSSGLNDSRNSSQRHIPKLLLPKFSRPAMYSLNGFIPKPNLQRLTTSTSTTIRPSFSSRSSRKESARSYNLDKNNQRKYGQKHRQSLEDSDDLKISGSVNRLSKRRGYLSSKTPEGPTSKSRYRVVGRKNQPGKDFPILSTVPKTSFDCKDHIGGGGFYADIETGCQVWHMCQGHRKHSFLCPNGTIFNQKSGVCDWWYNVDCEGPITFPTEAPTPKSHQTNSGRSSIIEAFLNERRRVLFP